MQYKIQLLISTIIFAFSLSSCTFLPSADVIEDGKDTEQVLQEVELSTQSPTLDHDEVELTPEIKEELENTPTVEELDPFYDEYGVEDQFFSSSYYYSQLTQIEKMWYIDMYRSITQFNTTYKLNETGITEDLDLDKVFQCLLNDHPELFYIEGYEYTTTTRGDEVVSIEFGGRYIMTQEEVKESQQYIDAYVQSFLVNAPINGSEYEKVKYIYECIILNTEYVLNATNNQNICSVFITRKSVCQGYAKAFMYLATELDIECIFVVGQAGGEGHAWNLVRIDGNYYYVDTTWGDSSYLGNVSSGQESINYDYLNLAEYEISFTHTLDRIVSLPEANQISANYYVKEGLYFTSYDRDKLRQKIEEYLSQGRSTIQIKASSSSVYQEIKNALIDNQEIFDYLSADAQNISYNTNDILLTLNLVLQ